MGHMKATISSVPAPGSPLSGGATAHCSHPEQGVLEHRDAALVTTWAQVLPWSLHVGTVLVTVTDAADDDMTTVAYL